MLYANAMSTVFSPVLYGLLSDVTPISISLHGVGSEATILSVSSSCNLLSAKVNLFNSENCVKLLQSFKVEFYGW